MVVATIAAMAVAFALGRWSSPQLAAPITTELDPWVVVAEAAEVPEKSSPDGKGQDTRLGGSATREVASQAPCTYTIVRGHARGRFLPLPEAAHG